MPVTTTLISPPAWVKSTIRRRTSAIQSMFSVPLSIAILAPAESANHSSGNAELLGHVDGGVDPPAFGLGQRAERARRVAEQDHAQHPLGMAVGDVADGADDDPRLVGRRRPVDRYEAALVVQVVLDELAGRMAGGGARGRKEPDDLGGVQDAAAACGDDPARALVERLQRLGRRIADLDDDALADAG